MLQMYSQSLPLEEAAARLKCHPQTVAWRMTRLGLNLLPDPADRRKRIVLQTDLEVLLEKFPPEKHAQQWHKQK